MENFRQKSLRYLDHLRDDEKLIRQAQILDHFDSGFKQKKNPEVSKSSVSEVDNFRIRKHLALEIANDFRVSNFENWEFWRSNVLNRLIAAFQEMLFYIVAIAIDRQSETLIHILTVLESSNGTLKNFRT